jgi:beta-lactamase regulating signal transducer with metallopeptidase domain
VRSASRLYRLSVLLSGVGVGVVALAAVAALQGLRLEPGSLRALIAACSSVLPSLGPAGYVELALTLLASASVVLGIRSLVRQLRATRRYLRALRPTSATVRVAGVTCRVIGGQTPRALCAGYLVPRIYVSQGALEALTPGELRAVVVHELHHLRRRDPVRLLVAGVLADALFFLPALKRIGERYAALVELAADEAAVRALGERRTLAGALLKFGRFDAPGVAVAGVAPERVDHLGGDRAAMRWRLSPAQLVASALAGVALLAAAGMLLAVPGAASIDVTRVLAQSCMLLIAAGGLAVAVAGGRLWRAGADRRRTLMAE